MCRTVLCMYGSRKKQDCAMNAVRLNNIIGANTLFAFTPATRTAAVAGPKSFASRNFTCLHFISCSKTLNSKIEQHMKFKFLVKLNKNIKGELIEVCAELCRNLHVLYKSVRLA